MQLYPAVRLKKMVIKIAMVCLGRAFQSASRFDPVIIGEIRDWDDAFTVEMKVLPKGPCMCLVKNGPSIAYAGSGKKRADLVIAFKNSGCAFPVMAGFINAELGFTQNRMVVSGDIPRAMSLIRCINRLQTLLLPRFICRRVLKRARPLTFTEHLYRLQLYARIAF